jgi:hypothetical protein
MDQVVEFEVPADAPPPKTRPNGNSNSMVLVEPTHAPPMVSQPTPMTMLSLAVERGANMDVIEKMMGLQERWEANEARKAFDEAIASAKSAIPPIIKDRTVTYPSKDETKPGTSYKHETLAGIAKVIDPILSAQGLSYRYRVTSDLNQPIRVTCIIAHRLGHCEETTLTAGADSSGSKNSIQAIGSTISYLQRYTLKAALGLAAAADDDGKAADTQAAAPDLHITAAQVAELEQLIKDADTTVEKFCAYGKVAALADIQARHFAEAKRILLTKKASGGAK